MPAPHSSTPTTTPPAPPRLQPIPPGLVSLHDHARHARQQLPAPIQAYFCEGAADGLTMQHNVQAWQQLRLAPRVLRPLQGGHTRTTLLGQSWDMPLLLAPVAYQKLAHPDGEYASAHAAAACGAGMVLSTQSTVPIEQIAPVLHDAGGPIWFQLYMQPDRARTLELVQRAHQAGCQALVLTVDAPVQGVRDAQRRSGFTLPPHIQAVHLAHWAQDDQHSNHSHDNSGLCQGLANQAPSWDDVQWLLQHSPMPVLLKGITHPGDARLAQQAGAAGVIVSNHGGRTLDTVPATAELLPAIRQAVRADYTLLVDGGIRRGTDIFKALALGAQAVLIGRPQIDGLVNAGAAGVAHVLRLLHDELQACMTLCGCPTVADIHPEHLWTPQPSAGAGGRCGTGT